jgi:hypothetical protein
VTRRATSDWPSAVKLEKDAGPNDGERVRGILAAARAAAVRAKASAAAAAAFATDPGGAVLVDPVLIPG